MGLFIQIWSCSHTYGITEFYFINKCKFIKCQLYTNKMLQKVSHKSDISSVYKLKQVNLTCNRRCKYFKTKLA